MQTPASETSSQLYAAITKLRALADTVSITAREGCVGWLRGMSRLAVSDPGVLAVLGPNKISYLNSLAIREDVEPDAAIFMLTAAILAVARKGKLLATAVPAGGRHLPLFIATIAILGDVVRDRLLPGARRAGILIISSDLDLRARYTTFQIGDVSIDAAYPGTRLSASGKVTYINYALRQSDRGLEPPAGVCFMYPTSHLPQSVAMDPRYVLLDFRYGREGGRCDDLLAWVRREFPEAGTLVLYTTGDELTAREIQHAESDVLIFDQQAVATSQTQLGNETRTTPKMNCISHTLDVSLASSVTWLGRQNDIRPVAVPNTLDRLMTSLEESLLKDSSYADPAFRRARWLYSLIRDFPLPLKYYEASAQATGRYTLKSMISGLPSLLHNPRLAAFIQSLAVLFAETYKILASECPRTAALLSAVEDAFLCQDDSIAILCKDTVAAGAIDTWLQDNFAGDLMLLARASAVRYTDAPSLQSTKLGVAIVSGLLPFQHRWLYEANLGHTAIHLCTSKEALSLARVLAFPFDPFSQSRAASSRYRVLTETMGATVPVQGTDAVLGAPQIKGLVSATTPDDSRSKASGANGDAEKHKLRSIGRGLESLALLLNQPENNAEVPSGEAFASEEPSAEAFSAFEEDEAEPSTSADDLRIVRRVAGLRNGETMLFLDEQRTYEVVPHSGADRLAFYYPPQLAPGDIVLLTDSAGRTSVFDQMLAIVEGTPRLRTLSSYRRAWNAAVRQLREQGMGSAGLDYSVILRKLRQNGADIESELTVKNWIDGSVIGPAKASSILAVGRLIDSDDMIKRALEYDRAFRTIRSIHQTLGKHINRLLRGVKEGLATGTDGDSESIDSTLHLPLVELMQSISPIVVEHVEANTQKLPASVLREFHTS